MCIAKGAEYDYHGLVHRAGALLTRASLRGDENAIVDFKYSSSPRITWWFDHHLSAFLTPQDHEELPRLPARPSLRIAEILPIPITPRAPAFWAISPRRSSGSITAPVADLIHWANIVDGALYESPQAAVEMAAPAMKLTLIIESTQDPEFIPRLIPLLTEMPLADVLAQPFVAGLLPPLLERHKEGIELIRSRSEEKDGTHLLRHYRPARRRPYNKFIPYYLHPDATYSIGLSKSSFRTKVSVGSNPWTKADPAKMINLAQVCERYGGGGHARVGAISFPPDQGDKARLAAAEIVAELRANNPIK